MSTISIRLTKIDEAVLKEYENKLKKRFQESGLDINTSIAVRRAINIANNNDPLFNK